jgi:hypothetical protein
MASHVKTIVWHKQLPTFLKFVVNHHDALKHSKMQQTQMPLTTLEQEKKVLWSTKNDEKPPKN